MRQKSYQASLLKLRQAGLDYSILPPQFLASRIICGVLMGCIFYWVVGSFDNPKAGASGFDFAIYLQAFFAGLFFGFFYPVIWLNDRLKIRKSEVLKTLPFFLDIITLCVEAGLNLQGAIGQAVSKGPKGVLRDELQRVLRDIRAGKTRADSLRSMAERLKEGSITSFCSAIIQAESMGMNLGPVLRAQADQRRSERFLRAEKLAMEAPVKMLFPLIAFIFPCTFIVLFFPIVMKFMNSGL
jgi:tight adherence protein C